MKVILFGASGMVGQGVLRECLLDSEVTEILSIVRSPTGKVHPKLTEVVHKDFTDFSALEPRLAGFDACFFCLGVSSAGMSEKDYRRITFDVTLAAAGVLAKRNRALTFVYVTGKGTDSTEKGPVMWARVKGETENALLKLPFKGAYMFRPGLIQPFDGIGPKNRWLAALLRVLAPLIPLLKWLFPKQVTSTRLMGRAMIQVAKRGAAKNLLESWDINELGGG